MIASILTLSFLFNPSTDTPSIKSEHPFLFINAKQVQQIKSEIAIGDWKMRSWKQLKLKAEKYLDEKVEIPIRGGNWEHNYVSPITNNELQPGKQIGDWKWEHKDKLTGQILLGDTAKLKTDYDGVVVSLAHDAWAVGVLQLGLAYQLSGDDRFAEKAKEILFAYCKIYPKLRERNKFDVPEIVYTGKGKVHVQDLNESIWLIDILQGTDLIWNYLKKNEQKKIIENIIKPAINVIIDKPTDLTNIQCWKNAAIGMAGFFLQDDKLINYALNDSIGGYYAQTKYGLTNEGFYTDLSPGYHFYSMNAMVLLTQAALNYGYKIDLVPLYKMFTVPLLLSNSKFQIPPFNDSRPINILANAYLYEWGYSMYRDSSFIPILNSTSRESFNNTGPIYTGWALLFGISSLPMNYEIISTTVNFPNTGITKLSAGKNNNNVTCWLKYSNHLTQRGHFHQAQLEFAVTKGNKYIFIIPGNVNYSSPLSNGWYRKSIAHNTLILNEQQQTPSSAEILDFSAEKEMSYVMVETKNCYDSISFIRSIILVDSSIVLIINQVKYNGETSPVIDLPYHFNGYWDIDTTEIKWDLKGDKNGYKYLKNATIKKNNYSTTSVLKNLTGNNFFITTASSAPFDYIKCYGQPFIGSDVATSLFRFKEKIFSTITVLSLNNQKVNISMADQKATDKNDVISFNITGDKFGKKKITITPARNTSNSLKQHLVEMIDVY
jgi:hypothetical protein